MVLEREIAKGGEGSVWGVAGKPDVVAKFYHHGIAIEQARKLEVMCELKSERLLRVAAWPMELLKASASGAPDWRKSKSPVALTHRICYR